MLNFLFSSFRLCLSSNPVSHTPSHARSQAYITHPPHSLAHAIRSPDSRPRPPRAEGGAFFRGRVVGGDEPGSSALSPAIHIQWVHSHTCLIAWPMQGGAHRGWRPLWSEDRRIVMVHGHLSSEFIFFCFCILLSCGCIFFHDLLLSEFRMSLVIPGRHQVRFSRSNLK